MTVGARSLHLRTRPELDIPACFVRYSRIRREPIATTAARWRPRRSERRPLAGRRSTPQVSSSKGKARCSRGGTRKFCRLVAVMNRSSPRLSCGTLFCCARSSDACMEAQLVGRLAPVAYRGRVFEFPHRIRSPAAWALASARRRCLAARCSLWVPSPVRRMERREVYAGSDSDGARCRAGSRGSAQLVGGVSRRHDECAWAHNPKVAGSNPAPAMPNIRDRLSH